MAGVTLEHISRFFRAKKSLVGAVQDLTLAVADRELVVILGPSGCGKTTTLRLIAGLESLSAGTIRIGERVVNHVAPRDRDVAMVFQHHALYPHMTVFDNMAFGLRMRGDRRQDIRESVTAAAGKLGLTPLLDRKPAQLSGGERQRAALGRAIVRKPQAFLFDEPLSHLDATLRLHMRRDIKTLQRESQTTMMYVTHDQEEAMALADRLAVMRAGTLQQFDTPQIVYDRPASRFVAEFIGTPPMNFFRGRIEGTNGSFSLVGSIGRVPLPGFVTRSDTDLGGRDVILGFRPHDLEADHEATASHAGGLDAVVVQVESLGDRINVYARAASGETVVSQRTAGPLPALGECIRLRPNAAKAHVFEADGAGRRLN